MPIRSLRPAVVLAGLLVAPIAFVACRGGEGDAADLPALAPLDPVDVAAGPGSSWPHLAADGAGQLVLGWVEPHAEAGTDSAGRPSRHRLRFARLAGGAWSAPRTIVDTADLFVNWADFPAVVPMGGDRLAAWWPVRNGSPGRASFGYDAVVASSADGGVTWTSGVQVHGDRTPTEHGFVSFVPLGPQGDSVGVVWLDGRDYARKVAEPADHRMQLAVSTVGTDGAPAPDRMLDTSVCTCCRTSSARTRDAVLVAYRDREPGEIRDIAVARYAGGQWAAPTKVHRDGWVFPGCPVNGAVLAAHGDTVAVAWFTAPHDSARVNVAFSTDGGRSFGPPTRVDDGAPSGRAGIVVDGAGSATVTWIERVAPERSRLPWRKAEAAAKGAPVGGAELRARRVTLAGARGPAQTLMRSTEGRTSGFPQIAAVGDTVYLAWTEPAAAGSPSRIRLARTTLARPAARVASAP
ncbi:sialidase family protein [Roseisolibacter sp. H3M3-2]|uniref:sialidase family protein n=1 Tax=Roseisolibacter sp. H3M3-2 TaxID=3031323 RepID=UPI0023DA6128|nr:sialidase family protein [Roseisolibacter sp. H3M3-2]MDF1504192.1 sialidase family protein [Roseisolibacter sp. H3M3-2]